MMKLALFLCLAWVPLLASGDNGSSGIGSARVPIVDDIWLPTQDGAYQRDGGNIVRTEDRAVVLRVEPIRKVDAMLATDRFAHALLGSVRAWEYLPDRKSQAHMENSWILCGNTGTCVKLSAEKEEGRAAAILLGRLKQ
jgi:hypothetical protein